MYDIYEKEINSDFAGHGKESVVCDAGIVVAHVRAWDNLAIVDDNFERSLLGADAFGLGAAWRKLTLPETENAQGWAEDMIKLDAVRPDHDFPHNWHRAINDFATIGSDDWPGFMYLAKDAAAEVPRLALLFEDEAEGKLPEFHQQYIHSKPEPIPENYLTCALGVRCAECPYLKALAKTLQGQELYLARAWTCVAHLIGYDHNLDLSEGFVKTVSDMMFWRNLHTSLAGIEFHDEDEADVD